MIGHTSPELRKIWIRDEDLRIHTVQAGGEVRVSMKLQ